MIAINGIDGSTGATVLLKTIDGSVIEPLLQQLLANPVPASNAFGTLASWVAKSAAGVLLSLNVTNANAAQRYLQFFNAAAVPAAGTAPTLAFLIPAGTAANPGVLNLSKEFFGAGGLTFSTGISVAISSTLATLTATTTPVDHVANINVF